MQRNNNGAQAANPACAACKHQRKKCTESCILAPYFPANRSREFQAVHKVFGVSNVTRILKNLREEDREEAVESLVWEACCRQKDPVLGSYGEYTRIFNELKNYKSQSQKENQVMQLPGGGGIGYKVVEPNLMEWSGTNGIHDKRMANGGEVVGNTLNYNNLGNGIVDSNLYGYSLDYEDKVIRQETVASGGVPLQQNSSYGFNHQQYYHPAGRRADVTHFGNGSTHFGA
ncbi:LOB domain-containing protein 12 [Quercus suber]|uniref:LOB domain-containing protein 12 n=1 Tax=Quercus suber TaxID=58331 RepID=UPI000CE28846|nr:LOB domain-containing protein 12 [Quercus suber]